MATALPKSHARFTAAEVLAATGGALVRGDCEAIATGVETDSRAVGAGELFVALRGERHDGHAFLGAVVAAGAAGVVVERDVELPAGPFVVRVESTLRALGDLAHAHRVRLPAKVVAITGSVGKTSTKELTAAVLTALGERVHRTEGNLNNLVGLPRTLLSADAGATVIVAELGMNVPGEIARLAEIARPDVGVVTSVAEVHTEGVGDLEGVAREKGALLLALATDAIAVATADDPALGPYVAQTPARRRLTFGRARGATIRIEAREAHRNGARVRYAVDFGDGRPRATTVELALLGEGAARNAGAALGVALALHGLAALTPAAEALAAVRPAPGRMELTLGAFGTLLLDDTYNASPRATENALEAAAEIARETGGRLVAVLGDMLELGALEAELHTRVGEVVARVGTALFVGCGPRMAAAVEEARELGADLALHVLEPLEAVEPVRQFARGGDVILVKGSRGMRMERVADALRTSAERGTHASPPPAAREPSEGAA